MTSYKEDLQEVVTAFSVEPEKLLSREEAESLLPDVMSFRGRRFVRDVLDNCYGSFGLKTEKEVETIQISELVTAELTRENQRTTSLEDISDELIRSIQAEALITASHKMEYDEQYPTSTLRYYAEEAEEGFWD